MMGHSMGGHGALTMFLKHRNLFTSVSAIAPICEPTKCGWGEKAFSGYLEGGVAEGAAHDAVSLLRAIPAGKTVEILVDVGTNDKFEREGQLRTDSLEAVLKERSDVLSGKVTRWAGYDHGYYFVQTVIGNHIDWHADRLISK